MKEKIKELKAKYTIEKIKERFIKWKQSLTLKDIVFIIAFCILFIVNCVMVTKYPDFYAVRLRYYSAS